MRPSLKATIIRHSCRTGRAVWIYSGPSKEAAKTAYYRTVKRERERQLRWTAIQRRRVENIKLLLQDCVAALPILSDMTGDQCEAIRILHELADNQQEFSSPFLEHDYERRHQNYLEKRRRKYWRDADFRQHERERRRKKTKTEMQDNYNYDK